jgi:hypothetical protein
MLFCGQRLSWMDAPIASLIASLFVDFHSWRQLVQDYIITIFFYMSNEQTHPQTDSNSSLPVYDLLLTTDLVLRNFFISIETHPLTDSL